MKSNGEKRYGVGIDKRTQSVMRTRFGRIPMKSESIVHVSGMGWVRDAGTTDIGTWMFSDGKLEKYYRK